MDRVMNRTTSGMKAHCVFQKPSAAETTCYLTVSMMENVHTDYLSLECRVP